MRLRLRLRVRGLLPRVGAPNKTLVVCLLLLGTLQPIFFVARPPPTLPTPSSGGTISAALTTTPAARTPTKDTATATAAATIAWGANAAGTLLADQPVDCAVAGSLDARLTNIVSGTTASKKEAQGSAAGNVQTSIATASQPTQHEAGTPQDSAAANVHHSDGLCETGNIVVDDVAGGTGGLAANAMLMLSGDGGRNTNSGTEDAETSTGAGGTDDRVGEASGSDKGAGGTTAAAVLGRGKGAGTTPTAVTSVAGGICIHTIEQRYTLAGMMGPVELNHMAQVTAQQIAQGGSDVAIRRLCEEIMPRLTRVHQVLLQWERCTGLGAVPIEGAPGFGMMRFKLPWNLRKMREVYPSLEEILTKFNQLELVVTAPGIQAQMCVACGRCTLPRSHSLPPSPFITDLSCHGVCVCARALDDASRVAYRLDINHQHAYAVAMLETSTGHIVWHNPKTKLPVSKCNGAPNTFLLDFLVPATVE